MSYFKKFSLILIAGILFSFTAKSQVVQLALPADSSECVSNNYQFEWIGGENVNSFEIQVAYDTTFNFLAFRKAGLTVNRQVVELPEPDSTYFWKVIATDVEDNKIETDVWTFRSKKAPPVLINPPKQELCVRMETEFRWSDIMADSYELTLYADSAGTDTLFQKAGITDTTYIVELESYNYDYYWTVTGLFGNCRSDLPESETFRTYREPAVNIKPENGAKNIAVRKDSAFEVYFEWSHIDTNTVADAFTIQISDTNNFSNIVIDTNFIVEERNIILELPGDYNVEYFWRIKQNFSGCVTDWSDYTSFKTQYEPIELVYPLDSATCVDIMNEFMWNEVDDATTYTIQVSDSSDFMSDTLYSISNVDSLHYKIDLYQNMQMFFWRVRAEDDNNIGLWSDTYSFMTNQSAPNTIYPADSAEGVDKKTTFRWQDKGPDAQYDVIIAEDKLFENVIIDTMGLAAPELEFELPEYNMNYYWRVRVSFSDSIYQCVSKWSKDFMFRTLLQSPMLIAPADSSENINLTPDFEWTEVETAKYYEIAFAKDSIMEFLILFRDSIPTTEIRIGNFKFEENTTYYWTVRSVNDAGKSLWAEPFMFTTGVDKPNKTIHLSPDDGSKKLPLSVEIVWEDVDRAENYRLQVATNSFFTNEIILDTVIADTNFTIEGLTNFVTYHWRVQSINQFGVSDFTEPWNFRTIDEAPEEAPVLFAPKNNAVNQEIALELSWSEVPKAYGYEVQVSTTETFDDGTLIENSRQNWKTFLYIYNLDYTTQYFWRVRAWSEAADAPWSDVFRFTTKDAVSVNDGELTGFDIQINPNPVVDNAKLDIQIPESGRVVLEIYNLMGGKVQTVFDKTLTEGIHSFDLNLNEYSSGAYIIKASNGKEEIQGKFIIK